MASVLEIEHLSKRFGQRQAVRDVSLTVREGEVYGFLGPNGAGKTTTIRAIVGLIRPTAGAIRVCGHDALHDHRAAAYCFGAIVENPSLYGFLSGRQNLRQFARMVDAVDEQKMDELMRLVGLQDRENEKVQRYSLGMRQRLGIAQALLGDPKILILDEPTNGLDPSGMHEVRELIKRLREERGLAVFLSSHLLSEVEQICQRVAVIREGAVVTEASIAELTTARGNLYAVTVSDTASARQRIAAMPNAELLDTAEESNTLQVSLPEETPPSALLRELLEAPVEIYELRRLRRSLEEAFLELTGDTEESVASEPTTQEAQR